MRRHAIRWYTEYARGVLRGHPGARIGARVKLTGPGTYDLARGCHIAPDARIWVGPGATLRMAHGSKIGPRSVVNVESGLTLGEDTGVSWEAQLMDTDFHPITRPNGDILAHTAPIHLGKHVLVGTRAMILKGVRIGDGAVIAAGSVVTKDVGSGEIVAGNPAKPLGVAANWE